MKHLIRVSGTNLDFTSKEKLLSWLLKDVHGVCVCVCVHTCVRACVHVCKSVVQVSPVVISLCFPVYSSFPNSPLITFSLVP